MPGSRFTWWTRERVRAALARFWRETGTVITSGPAWDEHLRRWSLQGGTVQRLGRPEYPTAPSILRYWPSLRQAWIAAGVPVSRWRDVWLPEDHAFLKRWWGLEPDAWVAAQLDRTPLACLLEVKRHFGVSRKDNVRLHGGMTAHEVGRLFGVDPTTVVRAWARRYGWLQVIQSDIKAGGDRRSGIPAGTWLFCRDCVSQFIKTHGWAYDWRLMQPDHPLTELAREVNERDAWLTVRDVRQRYGKSGTWIDLWRERGLLKPRLRPTTGTKGGNPGGQLVFRQREIEAALPEIGRMARDNMRRAARATRRRLGVTRGWRAVEPTASPPDHLAPGDWVRVVGVLPSGLRSGRQGTLRRFYWGFAGSRDTGKGGHKRGGRWMAEVAFPSTRMATGEKTCGVPVDALQRVGPRFSRAVIEGVA